MSYLEGDVIKKFAQVGWSECLTETILNEMRLKTMNKNLNKHMQMVQDFHKAFKYPRQLEEVSVLQVCARVSYLYEEASELLSAVASGNKLAQLDAVCDLAYFTLGTIDMMKGAWDEPMLAAQPTHIVAAMSLCTSVLMGLGHEAIPKDMNPTGSAFATLCVLYTSCEHYADEMLGADFDGAFTEVQRSNMSKLDEYGEPIYREDGKILKGPNFSEPNLLPYLPSEEETV